jgi:hypothetical protein
MYSQSSARLQAELSVAVAVAVAVAAGLALDYVGGASWCCAPVSKVDLAQDGRSGRRICASEGRGVPQRRY